MLVKKSTLHKIAGINPGAVWYKTGKLNKTKARTLNFEDARGFLQHYFRRGEKIIKKVHTFFNFKGGTGKTTVCFQVAELLSLIGYKVLAIDLDPQAHLTNLIMKEINTDQQTIIDVLLHNNDIRSSIRNVHQGLDIIPANLKLTKIEVQLSQKIRREECLSRALNPIKEEYDFIVIDTNPAISSLNFNAVVASDSLNIICETQPLSLEGLRIVTEELGTLHKDLQKEFYFKIIANKYDLKTSSSQEVMGVLRHEYENYLFQNVIRKSEDFNTASKLKDPLFAFVKSESPALEDIIDVVKELLSYSTIFAAAKKRIKEKVKEDA